MLVCTDGSPWQRLVNRPSSLSCLVSDQHNRIVMRGIMYSKLHIKKQKGGFSKSSELWVMILCLTNRANLAARHWGRLRLHSGSFLAATVITLASSNQRSVTGPQHSHLHTASSTSGLTSCQGTRAARWKGDVHLWFKTHTRTFLPPRNRHNSTAAR